MLKGLCKMRVVITGASGQLGSDLTFLLKDCDNIELFPLSKVDVDVTDQELVKRIMSGIKPSVILHCAANTNVDGCEINPDSAYKVNTYGTRNVAVEAERHGSKMIYISTDYVFEGKSTQPYHEFCRANPINVYGVSKLAGEELVKSLCKRFFIVRTSWVYGWFGSNFVKTILRLARERNELKVVDDQVGSPTFSYDLAKFIVFLMMSEAYGIYHVTNSGQCSWYEFAREIINVFKIDNVTVLPIKSTELYGRIALRPHYSVLGDQAIRINRFPLLPAWQEGLRRFKTEYYESIM